MRAIRAEKLIVGVMLCGLGMAGLGQIGDAGRPRSAPKPAVVTFFMPDDATGSIGAEGGEAPEGWASRLVGPRQALSDVGLGLFGLGAVLLLLLAWHNRQLRRSRDRAEALARDLGDASRRLERANAEISAANAALERRNESLGRRDRELGLQNRRFDAALNNMSQGLCMVDGHERLVVFNRRFAEMFSVEVAPVPGILLDDLVALTAHPQLDAVQARQRALAAAGAVGDFAHQGGDGRALQVSHRPMPDGGWVATYEDVTQRRESEARISFLALHDPLTGLLNRAAFERRLAGALDEAAGSGGVAVHRLDIDGFRDVNDGYGHPVGDALLREAGRRLAAVAREGDAVARISGDEFALLRSAAGRAEEGEVAARLVALMGEPFEIGDRAIVVGAGVGTALAPGDGDTADALLIHAHLALGQAKLAGRNALRFFEPDMDAARRSRRALERDLHGALRRGEIEVHFQPLVDARKLSLSGYETLARWRHPARGMVSPTVFIPVAEETGLIAEIGAYVLREACRQAAGWPRSLTVAVNLSPAQFAAADLVETIDDALERSGLEPRRLEIEITENLPLGEGDGAPEILHALRSRGIRIAMDDFGTGYASLSYLRRFPFDKIKIDQSFVRELSNRPDCIKIVHAMAALAASLGMTTTAEGVETAEQFAQLQAAGCDQVQGFHFGRPRPAGALTFAVEATATGGATAAA